MENVKNFKSMKKIFFQSAHFEFLFISKILLRRIIIKYAFTIQAIKSIHHLQLILIVSNS